MKPNGPTGTTPNPPNASAGTRPNGPGARPAFTYLSRHELERRVERALAELADCRACPRDCGVNRPVGKWAARKTGRHAVVGSYFPHFGEEDCLRGWNGSGTIFFTHCNLRCVFCQNFDISQAVKPKAEPGHRPEAIAAMMLELQALGCHNINFCDAGARGAAGGGGAGAGHRRRAAPARGIGIIGARRPQRGWPDETAGPGNGVAFSACGVQARGCTRASPLRQRGELPWTGKLDWTRTRQAARWRWWARAGNG